MNLLYMDTTTILLLGVQTLTLLLLIISESLPMSSSPYSGILQAVISKLEKKTLENLTE